jgi:hypothetical protein
MKAPLRTSGCDHNRRASKPIRLRVEGPGVRRGRDRESAPFQSKLNKLSRTPVIVADKDNAAPVLDLPQGPDFS